MNSLLAMAGETLIFLYGRVVGTDPGLAYAKQELSHKLYSQLLDPQLLIPTLFCVEAITDFLFVSESLNIGCHSVFACVKLQPHE